MTTHPAPRSRSHKLTSVPPPHVSTLVELHAPRSKALPVSPVGEAPLPEAHLTIRRAGRKLQARSRLSAMDTMNRLLLVMGVGPFGVETERPRPGEMCCRGSLTVLPACTQPDPQKCRTSACPSCL